MKTLIEHVLLLEYDHDKTMDKYGQKIGSRMWDQAYASGNYDPNTGHDDDHLNNVPTHEFFVKHFDDISTNADPTPHREYGQWIARHYAEGGINHYEDIESRVGPALKRFHDAKIRKQLAKHGINPDINQHKGLSALEDAVEKLPQEKKDEGKPEPHEYEKHDDTHWIHVVPKTEKAAKYYGRGTRWCTAADNNCMFKHYAGYGHLHIFIPKEAKYSGEKYQLHHETGQFMDERDSPRSPVDVFSARPSESLNALHRSMIGDWDHQVDTLGNDPRTYQKVMVAKFSGDPEIQKRLAKSPSETVRRAVAGNSLHPEVHRILARDRSHDVREIVAQRSHDPETLTYLAKGDSGSVSRFVATNRYAPNEAHVALARHPDVYVRGGVAQFSKSHDAHTILSRDPDRHVRHTLAHYSPHLDVLNRLAGESDGLISSTAKNSIAKRIEQIRKEQGQ